MKSKLTMVALVALLAATRVLAQCQMSLTDITDHSQSAPSAQPIAKGPKFRLEGSGAVTGQYDLFLWARRPGSPLALDWGALEDSGPNAREITLFCFPDGEYEVFGDVRCDGELAKEVHQVIPVQITNQGQPAIIAPVTAMSGGGFRIDPLYSLPFGGYLSDVKLVWERRLPDGTYTRKGAGSISVGQPVVLFEAIAGDRVTLTLFSCSSGSATVQLILGERPLSIEVAVLDGDGQAVEARTAVAQPLRVRFVASAPSFDLSSLSAVFEIASTPAGAAGYGIGVDPLSLSPVSYTAPVARDGTASAIFVGGDKEGPYVVRVSSPRSATGGSAVFTTHVGGTPSFAFELPPGLPDQRMLVHKYRDDDAYPSPYQVPRDPTLRPRFRFPGLVTRNGQTVSHEVWLRVVDPKDSAPYIPSPRPNDNDDPRPKGLLLPAGCDNTSCGATSGAPLRVMSDAGGHVEVLLEGTDRYAGDNYQLEASFDPQFTCATAGPPDNPNQCAKSAVVTA